MIKPNNRYIAKIIIGGLFTLVVILGILSFVAPPSLFPDPANGFLVMRSMEMGGKFNMMVTPDQDDFSKNTSEFLTWWSPGQYLVPYAFKLLFSVNSGQASALTVLLCQLLGLAGFYVFFKKVGFTPFIAALSMLFIACQQFFVVPYVFYNGGEILSFAFTGWFLYGCVAFKGASWQMLLFILLSGWVGFFCKSSTMWVYAAGLLFMWIRLSSATALTGWIKNGIWIAIPAIVAMGTIYVFFLSKGQNPASASAGLKLTLKTFAFPLASPLLSGFSIDDISHGLIYHTGKAIFNDWQATVILILLAISSLWLVRGILKKIPDQNYRLLMIIFYTASFIFFSYVYLMQKAISYEARHFRVIGLLVIPGAIYLFSQLKSPYRHLLCIVWAGIAFTSIFYLVKGYLYNKNKSAHGVSGIAQQTIDQTALNKVIAIDQRVRNATFVFVNKELGLEIQHNRTLGLEPIGEDLKIDMNDYQYDGHAGPLYIILPDNYAGPKEKFLLKSFPNYKGWYGSMLSDKYVMYEAP
ncbi:hypothetical protein [Mucilaginibacter sp. BT774]|uniref:hypothetical protein n=1 Tax=Mucilaginibacter sp. BT774 TaxID=3062276 RepID=UPI002675BA07|nr:hypothetical protein [Mucilaginibacter sp. BT774]MDO3627478.1 hypothetical protein [Mucilaginibacter sp. BT774]